MTTQPTQPTTPAKADAAKPAKPAKAAHPAKLAKPTAKPARSTAGPAAARRAASSPVLLSGGNPQIAKADGDAPVQAYIAALPGWKQGVAARLDALVMATVPQTVKAVRWNSPFYGLAGQGWFLGVHAFTGYLKLTFFQGAALTPAPAGGTGKDARWIDLHEHDVDEARLADWIRQAAALPGWGKN